MVQLFFLHAQLKHIGAVVEVFTSLPHRWEKNTLLPMQLERLGDRSSS